MHDAVLDHRRAQHDAGVHLAEGAEVADATGIDAALVGLQLVDDLHGTDFGRAGHGTGGKAGTERVDHVMRRIEQALDVRHDVHDVAVALDTEALRDLDRPGRCDPADVVAAEIEQHEMLRALLFVGEKVGGERLVLGLGLAAPAGAGDRPDRHHAVAHPDQDFRARADDLKPAKVEIAEKWRRIDPSQRAIQGESGQGERREKALRQDDLEDIAGANVILRPIDHGEEAFRLGIGHGNDRLAVLAAAATRAMCQRPLQRRDDPGDTLLRLRVGGFGRNTVALPHRRHDRDFVAHGVEDHHQRRAHEDRIRNPDGVGLRRRQPLHLADHVVAEIAKHPGRHRRHRSLDGGDSRLRDQRAQGGERRLGAGHERLGIDQRVAGNLGAAGDRPKHHVRVEPDHRIAAPRGAALDRFEQKAAPLPVSGELEEGRHRRLEVGDQPGHEQAGVAGPVAEREVGESGFDHGVITIRWGRHWHRRRWPPQGPGH